LGKEFYFLRLPAADSGVAFFFLPPLCLDGSMDRGSGGAEGIWLDVALDSGGAEGRCLDVALDSGGAEGIWLDWRPKETLLRGVFEFLMPSFISSADIPFTVDVSSFNLYLSPLLVFLFLSNRFANIDDILLFINIIILNCVCPQQIHMYAQSKYAGICPTVLLYRHSLYTSASRGRGALYSNRHASAKGMVWGV